MHWRSFRLSLLFALSYLLSCGIESVPESRSHDSEPITWTAASLKERAADHLDSTKWDHALFQQDLETYKQFPEVFQSFPLHKSPFPVATYDYAVSSEPFKIDGQEFMLSGLRIGEYLDPSSDDITDRLCLMILSDSIQFEGTTLVESRNYPYLTAQGVLATTEHEFDWLFTRSPDGYSFLVLNMKLFDLRFGESIIIRPLANSAFYYEQLDVSPKDFKDFEAYKAVIAEHPKLGSLLHSKQV